MTAAPTLEAAQLASAVRWAATAHDVPPATRAARVRDAVVALVLAQEPPGNTPGAPTQHAGEVGP